MKCVYPLLTIKVVTQAFVCPELCLFQLWANLPGCYPLSSSLWLTALLDWSRLELSWLLEDFRNSFGNWHSSNISLANIGLPKWWKMDMGRWLSKALMKGSVSHLTECIIQGSGEEKICQKSVYSTIRLECTHLRWLTYHWNRIPLWLFKALLVVVTAVLMTSERASP